MPAASSEPTAAPRAQTRRAARLIDRASLVRRHSPRLDKLDPLSPLSLGNGEFAFGGDITGLQTFPREYENATPLCTMSQWGWHTGPLPGGLDPEALRLTQYDTHGRPVCYQTSAEGQRELYDWLRENPHRRETMRRTLRKVMKEWRWAETWGWDYPMTAMTAARLGEPGMAVDALLMTTEKNRYLPNGHNWQRPNLPCYLPGNGGLLYAVGLMAGGWQGAPQTHAPGFPADGSWTVRREKLNPSLLRNI